MGRDIAENIYDAMEELGLTHRCLKQLVWRNPRMGIAASSLLRFY